MRVDAELSNVETVHCSDGASSLRGIEIGALLQAILALRDDGLLSDVEYQLKRQRLVSQR